MDTMIRNRRTNFTYNLKIRQMLEFSTLSAVTDLKVYFKVGILTTV